MHRSDRKKPELTREPAQAGDVPVIVAQARELILTYEDPQTVSLERALAWTERKNRENLREYTRISRDGAAVGYYRLSEGEDGVELDDFFILPEFRRQGIGTAALESCLLEAGKPVFLYVFQKNETALRLYRRMGFQRVRDVGTTRMILRWEG